MAGNEQSNHPAAVASVGLEKFEHAGVVGPGLAGQGPGHVVGEVVVADADGVGVAEGDE
jgi:hypothetical protein